MTALKPIENRNVRGIAAESYPSNLTCAHPECSEPVTLRPNGEPTVHHIFPRSQTKSASYFVEITEEDGTTKIVPHAVGLCGSGTTGHHGDVEEHRAWIKLEDGVYVLYESIKRDDPEIVESGLSFEQYGQSHTLWRKVGPLNPQPGSREGKPKRKRFKGEARKQRKTISLRVPDDGEDGAALYDEAIEILEERLSPGNPRPPYYTIMAALDFTILNAGPEDFE